MVTHVFSITFYTINTCLLLSHALIILLQITHTIATVIKHSKFFFFHEITLLYHLFIRTSPDPNVVAAAAASAVALGDDCVYTCVILLQDLAMWKHQWAA